VIPTAQGQITVLPGHAALLASLGAGTVELHTVAGIQRLVVCFGSVEIDQRQVLVLAEVGEWAEEIDVDRARLALHDAGSHLKNLDPLSDEYRDEMFRVQRAQARLTAASI
jgi:F-type H+-transporting ATPase subunit epsilon